MTEKAVDAVSKSFPNLRKPASFKVTSPKTGGHNCIAYAAGDETKNWWPIGTAYWPPDVPKTTTIDAFEQAYAQLGYEPSDSDQLEEGHEKVAIYGKGPTDIKHAAKQLPDGSWSSKLGPAWDIKHLKLDGVSGDIYGTVLKVLKRKVSL